MIWKECDFESGIIKVKSVLLYGTDSGLIDEYKDMAIKKLSIDKDNLFVIDSSEFSEKQDLLYSECCCPSMFGGNKMTIINNVSDSDTKNIEALVTSGGLCSTVVICAGELRSGGSLRKLFEASTNMACLQCYTDNAQKLTALIRQELSADAGITQIAPDALNYMISHLGEDRGVTRGFLQKIALYTKDKKTVELTDVQDCLPDTSASNLDNYLYSLSAGIVGRTMNALDKLLYDKYNPNALVRILMTHFKKIQMTVSTGQLPVIYGQYAKTQYENALKIWGGTNLNTVFIRLNELEKNFRTTGMPMEILLRDFSLKLALHAATILSKKGK